MEKQSLDFSLAFASAAHDVKNSVGLLMHSFQEFAASNPPKSESDNKRILALNYEASRINNDMMQLLSIYRLENNRLFVSIEEEFVKELLEDELLAIETLLSTKGLNVRVECSDDLCWYFDGMLLRNILNGILVNTVRYTETQILVTAKTVNDYLCLTIEDDGAGYPEIFCEDPGGFLTRIESNTGSIGLSLYLSEKVANMHSNDGRIGHIEIDNDSELKGGAFRIYLP